MKKPTKPKLKPCPFCKGDARLAEQECVRPTLLEAAEAVTYTWRANMPVSIAEVDAAINNLYDAVRREKEKPVRNCDRYRTAEEAYGGFMKFCNSACNTCPFRSSINNHVGCRFTWLYAEAGKEETK